MDRRMISTKILGSSIFFRAGTAYKEDPYQAVCCQIFFLSLILEVDDWGRGKFRIDSLKSKAFMSTPELIVRITDEQIQEWIEIYKEDGAIETYEIENDKERYFRFTGWEYYQRGRWRPRASKIPPSPKEKEGNVWKGYPFKKDDNMSNKEEEFSGSGEIDKMVKNLSDKLKF